MVNKEQLSNQYQELLTVILEMRRPELFTFEQYVKEAALRLNKYNVNSAADQSQIQESVRAICRFADEFDFGPSHKKISDLLERLFAASKQ